MQHVLDEDGEHHGHEDGVLRGGGQGAVRLSVRPAGGWLAPEGGMGGGGGRGGTSKPKTNWTEAPRVRML